jgi:hypothetical protein
VREAFTPSLLAAFFWVFAVAISEKISAISPITKKTTAPRFFRITDVPFSVGFKALQRRLLLTGGLFPVRQPRPHRVGQGYFASFPRF